MKTSGIFEIEILEMELEIRGNEGDIRKLKRQIRTWKEIITHRKEQIEVLNKKIIMRKKFLAGVAK